MNSDNKIQNFIPISRKLFNHEFWEEKRAFSRFEAWLDLIALARFTPSENRMLIGNQIVTWNRGEMAASLRYLAERWGWGVTKVRNYIILLTAEEMIKTRTAKSTPQTIITICNYDTYNPLPKIKKQDEEQHQNSIKTPPKQDENKTNIDNKEEDSKERKIYRGFAHLVLFVDEYLKLEEAGFAKKQIDDMLDDIENFKGNKKYTSLYLTTKKWLQKQKNCAAAAQNPQPATHNQQPYNSQPATHNSQPPKGRVVQIANAFQQALQHG